MASAARFLFWSGLGGAGFVLAMAALYSVGWLPARYLLVFVQVGLIVEVGGFGSSVLLTMILEVPKLLNARQHHAEEMDVEFRRYREMIAWLRRFSVSDRSQRLRFVRGLRSGIAYRMGLLLGGLERLGMLPMLVGLYLQFKDWRWGDWDALLELNLVGGLLVWAIILLYGMGWLVVGLKVRLDTYELLLSESLEEGTQEQAGPA